MLADLDGAGRCRASSRSQPRRPRRTGQTHEHQASTNEQEAGYASFSDLARTPARQDNDEDIENEEEHSDCKPCNGPTLEGEYSADIALYSPSVAFLPGPFYTLSSRSHDSLGRDWEFIATVSSTPGTTGARVASSTQSCGSQARGWWSHSHPQTASKGDQRPALANLRSTRMHPRRSTNRSPSQRLRLQLAEFSKDASNAKPMRHRKSVPPRRERGNQ